MNNPAPPMTPQLTPEMLKEKEALLWKEVRAMRDISLKLLQWSATALASLQTALFFLSPRNFSGLDLHSSPGRSIVVASL